MELKRTKQEETAAAAARFPEQRKYWQEKLSGELPRTGFPATDISAGAVKKESPGGYHSCGFQLPGTTAALMQKLSGASDPKLFMILTAGVIGLLYKYTANRDILVGAPIYRQAAAGMYLNTVLILRNRVDPAMSFKNLLIQVRQTVIEANKNQNYNIERLVYDLKLPGTTGEFPLADVAVLLENIHDPGYIEAVPWGMVFSFSRQDNRMAGKVTYRSSRYTGETVERIVRHYRDFLEGALSHIDSPLSAIEILLPREKEQLVCEFNATAADYPGDKSLQRLFAEQVSRTPDRAAAGASHSQLSYRELQEKSRQLAQVLQQKGAAADTVVGLLVDPSIEMVIGIWGILKAGAAYLPIDPDYPEERKQYMLKDSGARVLLKEPEIPTCGSRVQTNPHDQNFNPSHLAYVIYTSGSTGKPKGVAVEHRNILNYAWWRIKEYRQTERDITLQFISLSFDGFCANFYPTLLTGGKLVMLNRDSWKDIGSIRDLIRREKVTNFSVVPSWYRVLIEGGSQEAFPGLRFVVLAGEKSGADVIAASQRLLPGVTLINEYGPTENSVTTTAHIGMTPETVHVIGKPIANTAVYILGEDLVLKPPGVPGELCISAAGLARGYLNRVCLTAENFVANPVVPGERLYRSGDMAAWLPEGTLRILGRADRQLKIRGTRIEPEEIENRLLTHEDISGAVVTGSGNDRGEPYLCAYLQAAEELDIAEVRNYLSKTLPEYLVPAKFVRVDKIPLTPNGKIDRKKLMETGKRGEIFAEYAPPRNPVQEQLAEIWKKELELEKIGINDNYFSIGGDSIKSISLLNIINNTFSTHLKIVDLYNHATIEKLAARIMQHDEAVTRDEYSEAVSKIEAMKKRILQGVKNNEEQRSG